MISAIPGESNAPAYAGLSHPGRVRQENQDRWFANPQQGIYIVSDGISGAFAGELAATIVVKILPRLLRKQLQNLGGTIRELPLQNAIAQLSDRLRQETKNQPGLDGMGATVVIAVLRESQALIGHLGDSRAYLWRQGTLQQLTKDHSLVQLLLDCNEITPEEAASHPARGQLTRYVGMAGEALSETQLLELRSRDRLLLCSNGLTNMLNHEQLLAILNQELSPQSACQRLIDAANAVGGKDNITVVILSVGDRSPEATSSRTTW